MQRVALINGENINQDYDLAKLFQSIAISGIVEGLQVQNGIITAGYAFIDVIRNGVTFPILFHNTDNITIDTTGTKKVYIEIDQTKINDGSQNNPNGSGIGQIKTGTTYPTSNFLKLASISSGTIIDERIFITTKPGLDISKANNVLFVTKNSNYTFLGTEKNNTGFLTTTNTGNITYNINLSLFNLQNGSYEFTFIKTTSDVNKVILDVGIGNTIDGNQTYQLKSLNESVTIKIVSSSFAKVVSTANKPLDTGESESEVFLSGENLLKGNCIFPDNYLTSIVSNIEGVYGNYSGLSYSSTSVTQMRGIELLNNTSIAVLVKSIKMVYGCNATRCIAYDKSGYLQIGSCTISSYIGTFATPIYIPAGGVIRILADNSGSAYNSYYATITGGYPVGDLTVTGGVDGNTQTTSSTTTFNIKAVICETISTTKYNIGDVTANTKLAIPFFGSGVASNTLGLSIIKYGSPSFPIKIRLETDNSGSPSGTLIDANATITQSVVGGLSAVENHGKTYYSTSTYISAGVKILTKSKGYIKKVNLETNYGDYNRKILLRANDGTILSTGYIVDKTGYFPTKILLENNTNYRIELYNDGTNSNYSYYSGTTIYTGTYINYVTGSLNGGDASNLYGIQSIEFETEIITNFTFSTNITINKGVKFWAVLSQNLDVVDANNYYQLVLSKIHTKIDTGKVYNNTTWSNVLNAYTSSIPISYSNSNNISGKTGITIIPNENLILTTITKDPSSTPTNFYVSNKGTLLVSGAFSGNTGTIISGGIELQAGERYDVEVDSLGITYQSRTHSNYYDSNFISSEGLISFIKGSYGSNEYQYFFSITSLGVSKPNLENRQSISSNLVLQNFMSKSNALYSYKTPKTPLFCSSNTSEGLIINIATGDLLKVFSSLTQGVDYYLSNNYGGISIIQGKNKLLIGKSVNSSSILKYTIDEILNGKTISFYADISITQTLKLSHNLGQVPKIVFSQGYYSSSYAGTGIYANGNQNFFGNAGTNNIAQPGSIFNMVGCTGTISEITDTSITLNITKAGSGTGTFYIYLTLVI